jgi:hypothetical protein
MRRSLLRLAEVLSWMAAGFAAFLAFRVFFIFLSVINPAFCDVSCDLGRYAVPVGLACFVFGWAPFVIIGMIHFARRSLRLWWTPHAVLLTLLFLLAMVYVAGVALSFTDVDGRIVVLAAGAAVSMLAGSGLLFAAVLLDRSLPPPEPEVHFFREDLGE